MRQNKILVKSLPGYGNIGLKKKEIVTCANAECSIKINDWCYNKKITPALIHLFKTKSAIRKIRQKICTCINSFIQNKKYDKNIIKNILYTFKHLLWLVTYKIICTHLNIYLKQKGNICSRHVTFIKKWFNWMIFFSDDIANFFVLK